MLQRAHANVPDLAPFHAAVNINGGKYIARKSYVKIFPIMFIHHFGLGLAHHVRRGNLRCSQSKNCKIDPFSQQEYLRVFAKLSLEKQAAYH